MLKKIRRLKLVGYGMIVAGLLSGFSWSICEGVKIDKERAKLEEQIFSSEEYFEYYNGEMDELNRLFESEEISKKKFEEERENLKDIDVYLEKMPQEERMKYKENLDEYRQAQNDQKIALCFGAGFVLPGLGVVAIAEAKKNCDDEDEVVNLQY